MARKDMTGLLGKIMGDGETAPMPPGTAHGDDGGRDDGRDLTEEDIRKYGLSPEMAAKLNQVRRAPTQRPRKAARSNDVRATFVVSPTALAAIREVAALEGKAIKDVVNEAFIMYAASYFETRKLRER